VEVLIRAVRVAIDRVAADKYSGLPPTILLDPRPEVRRDPWGQLAVEALQETGFHPYAQPGIPAEEVRLLSDVRLMTGQLGTSAIVSFSSFGVIVGTYFGSHVRSLAFEVHCSEAGCVLSEEPTVVLGSARAAAECREDFFSRTPEERRGCTAWRREPGAPLP